jgi:hypothetical protein
MWRTMIYGVLMWGVTVYAFRRGGWAEKLASVSVVTCTYASALVISPAGEQFQQPERQLAAVDLVLFLILALITVFSRKFWPLWLTAFQGVTILSHLAPYVHVAPWIYHRAAALWSWPMLVVLAVGVSNHRRIIEVDRSKSA